MPFLIPLLSGVASFFGGAYVGKVVNDATAAPAVNIQSAEVAAQKSKQDYLLYGLLGLGAYFVFKKVFK